MISSDAILERANELKNEGRPFVLATVVRCESPSSAKPGAKAIVAENGEITGWIGGGCAQPAVIATAKKALLDGQARLIRVSPTKSGETEEGIVDFGMTCHSGGTLDIFLEPFAARANLLIIGAAPSAQSLAGLAQRTGFDVSVAFPEAKAELFPDAGQVIAGLDLADLGGVAPDFVVVATQGKRDEPGLEAALSTASPYIAFIASGRKADKLRTYLKERGHDPQRVEAIVSPAGLEIGAVTPEEIALSVLAELVKVRRKGLAVADPATRSTLPDSASAGAGLPDLGVPVPEDEGGAIDPVCGMSVDIASAEFRSEHQGRSYYFCCAGCQHSFDKAPAEFLQKAGMTP